MPTTLRFREVISRRHAEEMLHAFVACGNHAHDTFFWTPQQVRNYYRERYDGVVECLRRGEILEHFENLLSATSSVIVEGSGSVGVRIGATGESFDIAGSGAITLLDYVAKFELAVEARDRAVERQSITEAETATYHGVASIEAFLNYHGNAWNRCFPNDKLPAARNVYAKVEAWVPMLSRGSWLDYKQIAWDGFRQIKTFRNNATHSSAAAKGMTLVQLGAVVNLFASGIALPLFQLHQVFHERVPAAIIRAAFAPEAIVDDAAQPWTSA